MDDALPIADLMDELGYRVTHESIRQKLVAIRDSADDAVLVAEVDRCVVGCISLHAFLMLHVEGRLGRQPSTQAPEEAQQQEWRQLGLGAQMLADLGVHRLRVLGTPRKLVALAGFGLEVVEYV